MGPAKRKCTTVTYAASESSGELAHSRSPTRTPAVRPHKQWAQCNAQPKSKSPGPNKRPHVPKVSQSELSKDPSPPDGFT